ncbi:MAG: hypothetical protein FK734_11115 [Asgard group archaeon]|nr:hypothetical protein [Asgard group archaeon]
MELSTGTLHFLEVFISSLIASSGFWLVISKKFTNRDISRRLLAGLAHDRITYLSMKYIERGWITHDEFENLVNFLYEPYKDFGGNGSAQRLIQEVEKLPIRKAEHLKKEKDDVKQQSV